MYGDEGGRKMMFGKYKINGFYKPYQQNVKAILKENTILIYGHVFLVFFLLTPNPTSSMQKILEIIRI